jgi:hypothetical protein
MGILSKMKKLGRKSKKLTKSVVKKVGGKKLIKLAKKSGILKKALKAVPVVGTAYAAYDIYSSARDIYSGMKSPSGGGGGLPALPKMASGSLPALTTSGTGGTGIIPKGPGGKWQMPWNDPNTPAILKQFSLDDQYLKPYYRAPKNFVVVHDANGKPYPMLKWAARKFGLWKPNKKPPISVGEHQAIKKADRAVKKIRKCMTTISRVDRAVGKGGKVKVKR